MPGAGGVRMANFLFHQAPKDGTAIAIPLSTIALLEAAGFAGVQYRTTDFTWLGRLSANLDITIIRKGSGIANLEDARTRQVVIAGATNGSGASIDPQGLNAFAGTKFKIISGYESSSAGLLAFERGEVDGATTTWDTLKRTHSKWLKDGIVDIIVQYGETRNKQLPDVPASAEFAKDARSRKLLALYSPGAMVGTALIAPPGIPEDVANLLRKAVDEIATDKSYLSELSVIGTEPTDVLTGAAMQDKLKEGMALRPEDTAAVKAAFH
jgi:tripartite-type tricarboxylate transporter receptor subunit TctC